MLTREVANIKENKQILFIEFFFYETNNSKKGQLKEFSVPYAGIIQIR
jgi:hypothetical protein